MPELSAGASVALGVFVGLLSTSIQSFGLTLQRKSHILEDGKEDHHVKRPPYKRRRWQLGMLMFVVANIVGSTIQITTLPLPVLSTLQASGLVFNAICATVILGEPFTRYSLAGTALVTIGAVLIGTFGAITEPSHNLDQLLSLLGRRQFVLWLAGTSLVVAIVIVASWFSNRIFYRRSPRVRLLQGLSYGFVSGILSAHSLLVAKSAVELLVRTIVDRHNEFNRWQSWMILLGLIFLALSQLYFLHRGLKLCSTSVLYPFVFCMYNIVAILDGLIYFKQTARIPILDGALIAVGTVVLLLGVLALSWRLDHEHQVEGAAKPDLAKARVATPRTALAPGMGFVRSEDEEDEDLPPWAYTRPFKDSDEETGLLSHRAKRKRNPDDALPDEQTPLLRTATTPANAFPSTKRSARPKDRLRRMTISGQRGEIWDELNDRNEYSYSSLNVRKTRHKRASTLGGQSRPRHSQAHWRRRSWWEGLPSESNRTIEEQAVNDDYETEEETGGPRSRRRSSARRASDAKVRQALAGWFKLRWWKSKRGGGATDGRDEGGEPSSST